MSILISSFQSKLFLIHPIQGQSSMSDSKMFPVNEEEDKDHSLATTSTSLHEPGLYTSSESQASARRPRIGFRKSRSGCYNCKRRKIKCKENRPTACNNCRKIQANCEYPREAQPPISMTVRSPVPSIGEIMQLQSTPTLFNLTDLRLFHHFLFNSYPHLPLGNDQVWVTDIASIAHSYEYLVHAVLGLAASHLSMTSTSRLESVGLSHRILAVKGLNQALSKPPTTSAESDAIVATCYALAMQTSYIGDCVEEFLTMLRGCRLVTSQKWPQKLGTVFKALDLEDQLEVASQRLRCVPIIDERHVNAAKASLENLSTLCNGFTEKKVLGHILDVIYACEYSSREAYFRYFDLCTALGTLPQTEFHQLISPTNTIMQILLAHFVAVLILIYPIKAMEWAGRVMGKPNRATVFRLDSILKNVPMEMRGYLDWPMRATASLNPESSDARFNDDAKSPLIVAGVVSSPGVE